MKTSRWLHWKALAASATLALLSYACWRALNVAVLNHDVLRMRVFAVACLVLGIAAAACLAIPAFVASEKRARERAAATTATASRSGDYTARFPTRDKVMAIILASLMALLTAFLWSRPVGPKLQWGITVLLAGIVYYAYRVAALSVRFTSNRITIRMFPRSDYIQRYSAITALRVSTGNLHLRFEDGRRVNIWSGMGEAEVMVKILQRKVDVLPEVR